MKNKISLLIIIVVSSLAVSVVIADVVSYREEKSVPFVAGVSQVSEEIEDTTPDIESEEHQISDTKPEEHQAPDIKPEEHQIQEEDSQTKTERLVKEVKEIEKPVEEQNKQEELRKEQEVALKIEKCKSERNIRKEKLIYEFENVRLANMTSLIREMEERSYQKCIQNSINIWETESGIDFSHISGSTYSEIMSSIREWCENSIMETRKKFQPELDKLKAKGYLEIEEQLESEYQQCLKK